MVFENGVKSIQAAASNGARTVDGISLHISFQILGIQKLTHRFSFLL